MGKVEELEIKLNNLTRELDREEGRRDQLLSRKVSLQEEITQHNYDQLLLQQTYEVLKVLMEQMSMDNVDKIEQLITFGLNTIFGEKYRGIKFTIDRSVKRDSLNYDFMLEVDGVKAPLDGNFGGGMICVASVILRFLMSVNLGLSRLIVLDESLAGVSEEFQERTAEFLNVVSKQLGVDILLVTHQEQFASSANKRYKCHKNEYKNLLVLKEVG